MTIRILAIDPGSTITGYAVIDVVGKIKTTSQHVGWVSDSAQQSPTTEQKSYCQIHQDTCSLPQRGSVRVGEKLTEWTVVWIFRNKFFLFIQTFFHADTLSPHLTSPRWGVELVSSVGCASRTISRYKGEPYVGTGRELSLHKNTALLAL